MEPDLIELVPVPLSPPTPSTSQVRYDLDPIPGISMLVRDTWINPLPKPPASPTLPALSDSELQRVMEEEVADMALEARRSFQVDLESTCTRHRFLII